MTNNSDNKSKKIPEINVEEGNTSKVMDGLTDAITGVAKTGIEIIRAPATIASRSIDGAAQGIKQGVQQGEKVPSKVSKGAMGTVGGTVQGTVKGSQTALSRIGNAVTDIGKGISKIGEGLKGGSKDIGDLTGMKKKQDKE